MRRTPVMTEAIELAELMMRCADLTLFLTQASFHGLHDVRTTANQWLNEAKARELLDFGHRSNNEYTAAKLASLARIENPERGVLHLSPYEPMDRSLCKTSGAGRLNGLGLATSKLAQKQDEMVTVIIFAQAFIGGLELIGTSMAGASLNNYQAEQGVVVLENPSYPGKVVMWHLAASNYVEALALLRQVYGDYLRPTPNGGVEWTEFSDQVMDMPDGQLTIGFTLSPAEKPAAV